MGASKHLVIWAGTSSCSRERLGLRATAQTPQLQDPQLQLHVPGKTHKSLGILVRPPNFGVRILNRADSVKEQGEEGKRRLF